MLRKNKITVKRLFLVCTALAGFLLFIIDFSNSSSNRITHNCVVNYNQRGQNILKELGYISPQDAAQEHKFCKTGFHPVITRKWTLFNDILTGFILVVCLPIALCTGVILFSRLLNQFFRPSPGY